MKSKMGKFLILLRRTALLGLAGVVAWAAVTINMADHYVDLAFKNKGDSDALDRALAWDPSHPRALTLLGSQMLEAGQDEQAAVYFQSAIMEHPADATPLILLAEIRRRNGDIETADEMAEIANRLMPVDAAIQKLIAVYWYKRGNLDRVVPHLSTALSSDFGNRDELFPIFLEIAENPGARGALSPITENPPKWWDSFASYAKRTAEDIDSLRVIAGMRKRSGSPISDRERNAYINRLKKEGMLAEAYLLWINGLTAPQRQSLAYLYNGGFEQEFSNSGFGWYSRPPKNSRIVVSTATTYGITGDQALYLSFGGKRVKFHHLNQSLYLNPGKYYFSGQVRPDKLVARRGLQWIIYCNVGAKGVLGKSELFKGASDWRSFEFEIIVPPECDGQFLRLHSAGNRDVDHEIKGEIWFDELRIRLQTPLSG